MLPWLLVWLASAVPPDRTPPAATPFIVRSWDTSDGLPQNSVTAIVQTRDGYLWLGTFGGLVRFDGHAFTVFVPDNSPGLASSRIVSLSEDAQGVLWIGTEAGLTRYERGRFTSYTGRDGLPAAAPRVVLGDRRGRVWMSVDGSEERLGRFDGRTFTLVRTGLRTVLALAEGPDGTIWVGTEDGVSRLTADGTLEETMQVPGPSPLVHSLFVDRKGRLWAGSDELSMWDGRSFVHIPLPVPPPIRGIIASIAEDADGTLWIGTRLGGIFHWREGGAAYAAGVALADAGIRSLLPDSQGNMWIGTHVGGLHRAKPRHVVSYQQPGRSDQSVGPVVGDGANGLWIGGTCGGLLHFDGAAFQQYLRKDNLLSCVWALHRDPDGTVWIGSIGGGLTRFADGRFTVLSTRDGLPHDTVEGITRDRDGALWIGTSEGVSRWDGQRVTNYLRGRDLDHDVRCIVQDRHGALWLGGIGGLSRFENGRFTRYTTAQGLSHDHVRAIHEDADGVLWIGTYGGGLNRLENGRFTTYGLKEGLPDTAVSRILEDDRGNLWMSGNVGVYRVARSQLNDVARGRLSYVTAVTYGTADGMVINETNGGQPAGWRTPDGKFWFPTIKGLVAFDPVTQAAVPPPVRIERAVVDGRVMDAGTLPSLGPGAVDAELHFTAIDLGAAEKTRFRYRLAAYDRDWIDSGTRRVAYYTKVPPGTYAFEVMATDSDGNWSTTPARVAVVVTPFWWQRRPVQALSVALLLAGTVLAVRHLSLRRARARVAELEREQAIERERSRIARDLHDDLGSRLTHIAMIADASSDDRRVGAAARDAARMMDELVWSVSARHDTVESFALYLAQFAEEHVVAAGVRCRVILPPRLPARPLGADVRRHLYLACKEAIHNAIKHARASEIRVTFEVDDASADVTIADDGCGLPAEVDPTGNGLRNYRERMEAAGGTLSVESTAGAGTRIRFRVPV